MKVSCLLTLLSAASLLADYGPTDCQGAAVVTMVDIDFWVGMGSNRSALVVDWADHSATTPALVWGYRWDGEVTGAEMLTAIMAADTRFYAKLNLPTGSTSLLYGLGYDANNDQQFTLDDATTFDVTGSAISGPADLALSVDQEDYYAEGWFTGLWHYGTFDPNSNYLSPYDQGHWVDTSMGMSTRLLLDGSWDSWTFTPTFDFQAFAENPHAAEPATSPTDFDLDQDTDGADFLIWQRGYGISSAATVRQGDATSDGMVDKLDLLVWQEQFNSNANQTIIALTIPEPTTISLTIFVLILKFPTLCRKKYIHEATTNV